MAVPDGVDRDSMMKQAQSIWTMLDEMAENNPQAYRKFIDKHMTEGKEYMKPAEPHMCVMTMVTSTKRRYFINFCSWNKIPEPKTPEDAIPVAGTRVLQDKDENGEFSYSGVAFNPKILEEFGIDCKNSSDRTALINLAIDYVHNQHKITLSRSFSILPSTTKFKGNILSLQKALQSQKQNEDDEFDEQLSELEKTFGLQGCGAKDSLMNKLANLSTEDNAKSNNTPNIQLPGLSKEKPAKQNLIQEMNSTNQKPSSKVKVPEYNMEEKFKEKNLEELILTIKLPGVNKVSECELDISEDDIDLTVEDLYHLNVSFPYLIDDSNASAKFNKNNSSLIIRLPVQT
ncbi:PIH1 domain-containing protein 2-like [Saccostrea cucullata]|uniref:PIH1 domain-containing protein 2-like n=1 Tax=Saccostrea cuccullata TaxID=36930 RepID=UPI002ED4BDFF